MSAKRTGSQYEELKESVRTLFEEAGRVVKKIPQPAPDPNGTQGAEQTDAPLEDPIKAMLSQRAQDILNRERERTGEGLAAILEKAVLNLESGSESLSAPVTRRETRPSSSIRIDGGDYRSRILNRVVELKERDNVSFEEIADRFNREGLRTFSGKGRWHGITITAIYNRLRTK